MKPWYPPRQRRNRRFFRRYGRPIRAIRITAMVAVTLWLAIYNLTMLAEILGKYMVENGRP